MGAASYNRGSRAITEQIERTMRPPEFDMMDALNALQKYPDAPTPWGEIRFIAAHGGWWAECPIKGSGFWYPSLHEAVRRWRVEIYGYDKGVWLARPLPKL